MRRFNQLLGLDEYDGIESYRPTNSSTASVISEGSENSVVIVSVLLGASAIVLICLAIRKLREKRPADKNEEQ